MAFHLSLLSRHRHRFPTGRQAAAAYKTQVPARCQLNGSDPSRQLYNLAQEAPRHIISLSLSSIISTSADDD